MGHLFRRSESSARAMGPPSARRHANGCESARTPACRCAWQRGFGGAPHRAPQRRPRIGRPLPTRPVARQCVTILRRAACVRSAVEFRVQDDPVAQLDRRIELPLRSSTLRGQRRLRRVLPGHSRCSGLAHAHGAPPLRSSGAWILAAHPKTGFRPTPASPRPSNSGGDLGYGTLGTLHPECLPHDAVRRHEDLVALMFGVPGIGIAVVIPELPPFLEGGGRRASGSGQPDPWR